MCGVGRDWQKLDMLIKMLVIVWLLLVLENVFCMYSNKEMEGYPGGFLADCPGSNKKAFITTKSLRELSILIESSRNSQVRRKYNYYQSKELAKDPDLDFSKRTMMFIGGFLDSPNFLIAQHVANTYKRMGYNVFMLETNYFTTVEYPKAARFMRPVGKHVAKMMVDLTEEGLDPKKLEIVGLSLGAHTASFIAKSYRLSTGNNISRITALDPAGPCFRNVGPEDRIDKSDADFVEMVGTNIDGYGMAAPVGHVNYYVNGGEFQPGEMLWFFCMSMCSHVRSYEIWLSSLQNPYSFIAIQCDSVQQARDKKCLDRKPLVTNFVGFKVDRDKEGIFYLATTAFYPFSLGQKGLKQDSDFYISITKSLNKENVIKIK